MYFQCIRDVSWMYYDGNVHVSLVYYGCIGSCNPHLYFPPYFAHHLFGAQPIRASRFGHQQPMGLAALAPVGWGQPRHGSTRHAFWQTEHACSSRIQHALLGAVLQKLLLVRHLHGTPTLHAPGLTRRRWAAVGDQTGPRRQ